MTDLIQIARHVGRAVPVRGDDLDTDRIIPARFMKTVSFAGLEEHVFEDARRDADGKPTGHSFDDPRYQGASVLLVNRNFGCGSSREHAPRALEGWGIRALIGESFAEIFFGNCVSLGIPAVTASGEVIEELMKLIEAEPRTEVVVDVERREVRAGDRVFAVDLGDGPRRQLLDGTWDATRTLLVAADDIQATADRLPYVSGF